MKMRPLEAIEIEAGAHHVLKPGGDHIMLMGLSGKLIEGDSFPLTLTFEKSGTVEIEVPIKGVAATDAGDGHEEHMHGEDEHGEDGHGEHGHGEDGHGEDGAESHDQGHGD